MSECCQDYYDMPKGHRAYHCSGEPNKYFYLPNPRNLSQFKIVHCQCTCHIGEKPKPKLIAIDTKGTETRTAKVSLAGMKKGKQIKILIHEGKSNKEILMLVDTSINSIRWHRTQEKKR